jgi:8-oxo-dGTP diphosphatase
MNDSKADSVYEYYKNKIRIRSCGLCMNENKLLLVNHSGLSPGNNFWAPPGGGLQFGETLKDCLVREFREETGLVVQPGEFLFACEFIQPPLHALELYFDVPFSGGSVKVGYDPEAIDNQILKEATFMRWDEIDRLPPEARHGIFNRVANSSEILHLRGHFKL